MIRIGSLPDDMQVLIGQISQDSGHRIWDLPPAHVEVVFASAALPEAHIPTEAFPEFGIKEIDIDDRPLEPYIEADPRDFPPVVVAHGYFLDGHHRVWAARKRGDRTVWTMDVSQLVRPAFVRKWNLGRMKRGAIDVPPETGATLYSLRNAEILLMKMGLPDQVTLRTEGPEWAVDARWGDRALWTFEGFSWGYYGEGSSGLGQFLDMIGVAPKIPLGEIAKWPQPERRPVKPGRRGAKAWSPRVLEEWSRTFTRTEHYGKDWE